MVFVFLKEFVIYYSILKIVTHRVRCTIFTSWWISQLLIFVGCKICFGLRRYKGKKVQLSIRRPGFCPSPRWLRGLSQSFPSVGPIPYLRSWILDQWEEDSFRLSQPVDLSFETICMAVLTEGLKNQTWSYASSSFFRPPSLPHFSHFEGCRHLNHQGSCLNRKWGSLPSPNSTFAKALSPRLCKTILTVFLWQRAGRP